MARAVPLAIAAMLVALAVVAAPAHAADCTTDRCFQCKGKGVPSLANKDKCVACEAIVDASVRQACYDCIESGVPSDPAQCLLCANTAEVVKPAGAIRCMDCMRKGVPADNAVDKKQCLICGTVADDSNRQKCFDCIERGVPAPADKGLCYHCAFSNNVDQCFSCLGNGVPADKNTCVTKWHINWAFRRIGDLAITAKCGDSIEFANPGGHNVLRLPGISSCPAFAANAGAFKVQDPPTASNTMTLPSDVISASNAAGGKIFYYCSVGYNNVTGSTGHCTSTQAQPFNMQVTVTLRNC